MEFVDKELEGAILSSILFSDPKRKLTRLHSRLFALEISRWVLDRLYDNPELSQNELYDLYRIEKGSMSGILDFIGDGVMTAYEYDNMISRLWDLYYKRELASVARRITDSLGSHTSSVIMQATEKSLAEMQSFADVDSGSLNVARADWLAEKDNREYMNSGLKGIDEITGGIKGGRIWVVGGESGSGKSFFGLQMALCNVYSEKNVLFFSTELTKAENFDRLVRMQGYLFGQDDHALANNSNFRLYDQHSSLSDIIFESRRQKRLRGVDLIIVDHVQNIDGGSYSSLIETITETCNSFRKLAVQDDVAVVLLSQLNKDGGFFGASKLNQVAHCSIKIERDPDGNDVAFSVDKNRSGRRGQSLATFKVPECVYLTSPLQ